MDSTEVLKRVKKSYEEELIKLKELNKKQLTTLNNLKGFYDKKLKSELEAIKNELIKQNNDKLKKLQLREQQRAKNIIEQLSKSKKELLNKLTKTVTLVSL